MNYHVHGTTTQVTVQDAMHDDRIAAILDFCGIPKSRGEIQQYIGIANREHFLKSILKPLIESGQLMMTIPDKPNSKSQK